MNLEPGGANGATSLVGAGSLSSPGWCIGEVGRAVVDLHRALQAASPHPAFLPGSVPLVFSGSDYWWPAALPPFLPSRSWGSNQLISNISFYSNFLRFYRSFKSQVQFSPVAQLCPTLRDPMNRSTPGLLVHHQLPEFTQTHVHRVSDAI